MYLDINEIGLNEAFELINLLGNLKFDTSNSHEELARDLTLVAEKHYTRATNLCKIESHKGKSGPEQLEIIGLVVRCMNNDTP